MTVHYPLLGRAFDKYLAIYVKWDKNSIYYLLVIILILWPVISWNSNYIIVMKKVNGSGILWTRYGRSGSLSCIEIRPMKISHISLYSSLQEQRLESSFRSVQRAGISKKFSEPPKTNSALITMKPDHGMAGIHTQANNKIPKRLSNTYKT